MRYKGLIIAIGLLMGGVAQAQVNGQRREYRSVEASSFWDDWFVQMGLDMSLQNPYGYNFSHVFPNGKSFGLDLAVGKWFTSQVGVRGKFNWENKLPLLKNNHANWLAPFYEPGVNRDKGGYIAAYGDALFNLHNLFGTYYIDRPWNLSIYPRIGVNYNFGVSKGALLAGVGVMNTFRLNERWSLYADVAYMMTGSGFVGSEMVEGTGTGSNSNGYFSIGVGAQVDLGSQLEERFEQWDSFWTHWFVQAGFDMSLMNPYGCNFSEVFPKGKTFGMNIAVGKQFSPDFALRGRVNWENGLFKNNHLEWVPPTSEPKKNYENGGFGVVSLDAMFNMSTIITGYDKNRKWQTSAFVRAGLISQFESNSASPLGGAGIEQTYRLNDRLSLYADVAYQVTTSESSGGLTGMEVSTGSNGFFDIDLGVKIEIGN